MIFNIDYSRENWAAKYQYKGETPLQTYRRTAEALTEIELNYATWYQTEMPDLAAEMELAYQETFDRFLKALVNMRLILPFEDVGEIPPEEIYTDYHGNHFEAMGLKCTMGGRITANIGTEYNGATLMNCYIAPPVKSATIEYDIKLSDGTVISCNSKTEDTSDNLQNIFLSMMEQAETLKSEGGYGMNFSFIRPRSSIVEGVGVKHPGVLAYMDIWDKVSEVIVKGGQDDGYRDHLENLLDIAPEDGLLKTQPRKGAMMAVLNVWHPDIEEFIKAKQVSGRLTKFNISVCVDDKFMNAVLEDDTYDLHFKGVVKKRIRARELFDLIMECSYNRASPGIIFFDNAQRNNPMLFILPQSATNPCGEVPGNSYVDRHHDYAGWVQKWIDRWDPDTELSGFSTVCLLGSINLTQYVSTERTFAWRQYADDVRTFANMLENVNDIGNTPLPHYQWAVENVRQYGMGLNGVGSTLLMMGLRYGSPEAIEFVEKLGKIKQNETLRQSALLAKSRGPAPIFSEDIYETMWWETATIDTDVRKLIVAHGLRNMKTTTNAPNGNRGVTCDNTSGGVEPAFAFEFDRKKVVQEWPEGLNIETILHTWAWESFDWNKSYSGEFNGVRYYYEPHNRGLCQVDTVQDYGYRWLLKYFPEDIEAGADYLVTSADLSVSDHVDMQAAIQRHVNQSVSKTINLPKDYPFEDYRETFIDAWKKGLIGVTAYREGSMESVLSVAGEAETQGFLQLMEEYCNDLTVGANCIVENVKLPDKLKSGDMEVIRREGNKYYMMMSYLPNDSFNKYPVAMWISTNVFATGEYVALVRAIKKMYEFMEDKGIDKDLIAAHADKVKAYQENYATRLGKGISMALRHNISVVDIVQALEGIEGDYISTTLTAARKFLKKCIVDGTVSGKECEACGSSNVIYEEGCSRCIDCMNSKCS